MKIVYLDQNKWIHLAQAYYERNADPRLHSALDFAQGASQSGTVVFPLSGVHYMETAKIQDSQRRGRLGKFMYELSGGYTLAWHRNVICHELEVALARRFPGVTLRPFELLSKGFAHAFGLDYPAYRIPEPFRSAMRPHEVELFEVTMKAAMELAAITGEGPDGLVMAPFGVTAHNYRFKEHLETLYEHISVLPPAQWEDALHAMSLADIQGPINEVLQRHALAWAKLDSLGKEGVSALLHELPTREVDLHLHRQILKNPQLKPRVTDLEDWSGLGLAAAHCDVLVCEKHFANLLFRDGFRPRAKVATDIRDLPDLL